MYNALGVYETVAVLEDGEEIDFTGKDYFFIDYRPNGDVSVLFFTGGYGWVTSSAEYEGENDKYAQYTVTNPSGEDLTFTISLDQLDIFVYKEDSDIVVAYTLNTDYDEYSSPTYGNDYNSYGYGNNYQSSGSNSSSSNSYSRSLGNGFSASEQQAYNRDKATYNRYDSQLSSHFAGNQTMSASSVRQAQQAMRNLRTKWENKGKSFPKSYNESR